MKQPIPRRLTINDRHLMRLIRKDRDAEGWCKVNDACWTFIEKIPKQLVETKANENNIGGLARLTHDGEVVLDWT